MSKQCARCGADEFRVNGYCSVACEDMAELEDEIARLKSILTGIPDPEQFMADVRRYVFYAHPILAGIAPPDMGDHGKKMRDLGRRLAAQLKGE